MGEVVGYLPGGLPALRLLFRRVHAALAPGGLLIFDFMTSALGRTYRRRTASGSGWDLVSRASYDRLRRVLTRQVVVVRRLERANRESREVHRVRIHSRGEMRAALERAGFTVRMSRGYGRHRLLPGDVVAVAERV